MFDLWAYKLVEPSTITQSRETIARHGVYKDPEHILGAISSEDLPKRDRDCILLRPG